MTLSVEQRNTGMYNDSECQWLEAVLNTLLGEDALALSTFLNLQPKR